MPICLSSRRIWWRCALSVHYIAKAHHGLSPPGEDQIKEQDLHRGQNPFYLRAEFPCDLCENSGCRTVIHAMGRKFWSLRKPKNSGKIYSKISFYKECFHEKLPLNQLLCPFPYHQFKPAVTEGCRTSVQKNMSTWPKDTLKIVRPVRAAIRKRLWFRWPSTICCPDERDAMASYAPFRLGTIPTKWDMQCPESHAPTYSMEKHF